MRSRAFYLPWDVLDGADPTSPVERPSSLNLDSLAEDPLALMALFRIRSFQGRIFLAIAVVVLVPATVGVSAGLLTLRGIGTRSGTLGAWDAVAESGRDLLQALDSAGVDDAAVQAVARSHREALSESVRLSRLYAFVADRFVALLPLAALILGVVGAFLALLTARYLSRGFGRPIAELAGWTGHIARGEPLPPEAPEQENDVTEIRTLRTALRSMAAELQESRERAVEAARMRSWTDLARRVAHELKNPLTPIRMAAATLAQGAEGSRAQAGQILAEEVERLDGMARTFAQYGRLPEGPRSDVDLAELLRALAQRHGTPAAPITIEGDGLVVHGHFDALQRAFRNLLLNAQEAQATNTADGQDAPALEVRLTRAGAWAEVAIRDHGPGIPTDLLDEVWNPDVTTKRSGTGLGLAIVRQTILHHDGTVAAANPEGGGALFTVRLPSPDSNDA